MFIESLHRVILKRMSCDNTGDNNIMNNEDN